MTRDDRFDDPDDPDVRADDQLVEDLRADTEPLTEDQVTAMLAAWRREVNAPGAIVPRIWVELDPAIEDWRVAMHQAARRAGERERRRLRRERWHRRVLWVVSQLTAAAGPLIRLLAKLPWKGRSW